ncbi:MAG: histidine kinase [Saprospiraceae bacterium]|nr:histidine kinase [Saprospiraceae bacterium]
MRFRLAKYKLIAVVVLMTCVMDRAPAQASLVTGFATPIFEPFDFTDGAIYDIEEDWNGFIWLATDDGLFQFDGTVLRQYAHSGQDTSLPHNQVFDIYIDKEKAELWLGTGMGVCRLNPTTGAVKMYQASYDDPNSIADNIVRKIFKDQDGQIWIGCYNHGLSLYREETDDFLNFSYQIPEVDSLQPYYPRLNESWLNSFKAIAQDHMDPYVLWLGTPLGLVRFDMQQQSFQWLFLNSTSPNRDILMNSVMDILPFGEKLLVGTASDLIIYEPKTGSASRMIARAEDGTKLSYVTHLQTDDFGRLMVSYRNGLARVDMNTWEFVEVWLDNKDLNRYYGIRLEDSAKRLWVNSSGATRLYDPVKQITDIFLLDKEGRGNPRVFKQIDRETLVMLTAEANRCHFFDLNTLRWKSVEMNELDNYSDPIIWRDIARIDEHTCLLLADKQIFRLDLESEELELFSYQIPDGNPGLTKCLIDKNNQLWVASRRVGLYRIDLESGEVKHYIEELNSTFSSSLYTWITDLHEDKMGKIWIRLARSFAIYFPEEERFEVFSHYQNPNNTFRYIRNFAESPEGEIWLASEDNGIGKVSKQELEHGVIQKYTRSSGLISDLIQQMSFDPDGRLWLLSNLGISAFDMATEEVQNYAWDRGIPYAQHLIPLSNSKVALALPTGLGIFDAGKTQPAQIIPQPYISRINNRGELVYEGRNEIDLKTLRFEHAGSAYCSFEFSAIGYSNPKQFAYRMVELGEEWIETSEQRSASYSNVSPGTYHFELKCRLVDGQWSEVRSLEIVVSPHWWQTWWFQMAVAAVLSLLAYSVYRGRLENVRQKERLKSEFQRKLNDVEMQALRSQMNPHFLFNSLNSIQMFIVKNQVMEAVEHLDNFSRLVRLILQNTRSPLVPLKEEVEALKLYMEMENLRFKTKFTHRVEVAPEINIHQQEIPPMLLQPFVENAIWHGIQHKNTDGEVVVRIRRDDQHLICEIEDDGIGRVAARKIQENTNRVHRSLGMKITKDRIQMMNETQGIPARIEIIDLYGEGGKATGTKVVVYLPVTHSPALS